MKKSHIVKLILFPLILGGCIAILDLLLFQKVSDDLTSYGRFYEEEDNSLDVVLVGNSTLREGYSPLTAWKEEGIMSRGFSSSPTHPEVIKVAIKEIMRKYSPKAIFIDLNGLTFQHRSDSTFFIKQYYKSLPDGEHKKELETIYSYLENSDNEFELFNNHNNFRQQQYWESLVYQDQFKTKGYQPNKRIQEVSPVRVDETVLPLNEDGEYYFNEIISECQKYQSQTKFIFGKMPKYNDVLGADEFRQSEYMFKTIENRLKDTGFEYMNFTKDIEKLNLNPKTDYKDNDHLNHLGALKFTRYFSKYIKDDLKIELKEKTEVSISSFDECYEKTKSYLEGIENDLKNKTGQK